MKIAPQQDAVIFAWMNADPKKTMEMTFSIMKMENLMAGDKK